MTTHPGIWSGVWRRAPLPGGKWGAWLILSALLATACATTPPRDKAVAAAPLTPPAPAYVAPPLPDQDALVEEWGVQAETVRLSAAGFVLDFRYRVIDPEKSRPILDRKNRPHLIHQETGTVLQVQSGAKVGSLRQNTLNPTAGRVYFALFTNPGRFVQSGDKVTVVIGDYRVEDLTVE